MSAGAPPTPLPVPPADLARVRTLVLYGGTFDPPHRAHVELPRAVLDALHARGDGPAWLLYVPAAVSPFKTGAAPSADAGHRVAMLRLATAPGKADPRTSVWTDEIDRAAASPGPSYSIDTARRAMAALGPAPRPRLRWLMGADQAAALHRWREGRALAHVAEPLVVLRRGQGGAAGGETPARLVGELAATGAWDDAELDAWLGRMLALPLIDAASSEIRAALAAGAAGHAALDADVAAYIARHGLYRPPRAGLTSARP